MVCQASQEYHDLPKGLHLHALFARQKETIIIEKQEEWKVDRQYEAILTIQSAHLVPGQSSGPHNNQFTRRNAQKRINSTRVFFWKYFGKRRGTTGDFP